ncbi:chaperonin-like RBCX protein 1, chloroplastic [Curcuma longa]|uniref:chaperonin-like RBCX protein 1, chloroplastic n=1 Tax=Curcuma longa TaxID=136217 RepID=UPI003D9EB4DB
MECIAAPFFSNSSSSVFTLKSGSIALPRRRCSLSPPRKRLLASRDLRCQKMYVPGFAEASPEAKAARNLQDFFTYLAVKIVLAQLESYNREAYDELMEFISGNSLNDGEKFCRRLMRESPRHKGLALRILEVRSAYAKQDFEWENLKKLAFKMVDESNTRLMRDYVEETSHLENEG